MYGRASIRISATESVTSIRRASGGVLAVDDDVFLGHVAPPGRGAVCTEVQVDLDGHLRLLQGAARGPGVEGKHIAVAKSRHPGNRYVEKGLDQVGSGIAGGAGDPAPVGVASVYRALE